MARLSLASETAILFKCRCLICVEAAFLVSYLLECLALQKSVRSRSIFRVSIRLVAVSLGDDITTAVVIFATNLLDYQF